MLAWLAPPAVLALGYVFLRPVRNFVDNLLAHLHGPVAPGTAPGTTPATKAPDVKDALIAVAPRYETDFGLTVTITKNPDGTYRPSWRTPDGRTDPGASYPTSDAATQAALDNLGLQFAAKPWDVKNPGGQPAPNAYLDPSGQVKSPQGPAPGVAPFGTTNYNPSTGTIAANWPRDTYGNPIGAAPPAPGAQVVGIPTPQGGVNVYVETDPDSPGNAKATFKIPPKTGPNDPWQVATGKTLQAAADSAATTIALLLTTGK